MTPKKKIVRIEYLKEVPMGDVKRNKGDVARMSLEGAKDLEEAGYARIIQDENSEEKKKTENEVNKSDPLAKQILDKYGTEVLMQDSVYTKDGKAGVNASASQSYMPDKFSENVVLWKAPNNWIRIEFDGVDANTVKALVSETESNLKALEIDYCITFHKGGVSPYINICNLKKMPLNEQNRDAKLLLLDLILSKKAKKFLDKGNLSFTWTPVIGNPHWKPKYLGAVHEIVKGTSPLEQENNYPEQLLKELSKSKNASKKVKIDLMRNDKWVEDFLLNYCCNNELPEGNRHTVINKNLAILIANREDQEEIISKYLSYNDGAGSVHGWIVAFHRGTVTKVSPGEIRKYIQDNEIPYDIFEEANKPSIESAFKNRVLQMFASNQVDDATEEIVKHILNNYSIITTRNDIKSEMFIYDEGIYVPNGRTYVKEIIRDILEIAYTEQRATKVISKIEVDTGKDEDSFFNSVHNDLIPVQNGVLNIKNRELTPFSPDLIFFNKLPVTYDPVAVCPSIDGFLKDIVTEPEDAEVLYEKIGYCLHRENFIEKATMFIGCGRNGKGKFLALIKSFLGVENCCNVPLTQMNNNSSGIIELRGKLANIAGDLSNTSLKDTGLFKEITGRDLITAKRKYLTDATFVNESKQFFSCNELPRVYDYSDGFWARWDLFEFPYTFVDLKVYEDAESKEGLKIKNPNIIKNLTTPEELSGLLNKALDGLNQILINGDFSKTKGTQELKNLWIRKADSFLAFCMDRLEEDENGIITKHNIRKEFQKYRKKYKLKGCSDKAIKITLEDSFGAVTGYNVLDDYSGQQHAWIGIKWKE